MKIRTKEQQIIVDFWAAVAMGHKQKKQVIHAEGYRAEMHIPYIPDFNEDHMLNLYYPSTASDRTPGTGDGKPSSDQTSAEKLPTVINIHGGGWMFSHLDDSHEFMADIASRGFAVMGMGYRLLPGNDLRGIVQDIFCSLHWLERFGPMRGFDLSRVLLTGDSAGGHLALLTACIQESPKLQEIYGVEPVDFKITTIGISCPCPDTDHLFIVPSREADASKMSMAYKELLLGEQGEEAPNKDAMSFGETIEYVNDIGKFPPVFLIGSENENLYYQTETLLSQFEEKGIRYEAKIWKKEEGPHLMHVFNVEHWDWYESRITNDRMLKYFMDC